MVGKLFRTILRGFKSVGTVELKTCLWFSLLVLLILSFLFIFILGILILRQPLNSLYLAPLFVGILLILSRICSKVRFGWGELKKFLRLVCLIAILHGFGILMISLYLDVPLDQAWEAFMPSLVGGLVAGILVWEYVKGADPRSEKGTKVDGE